jgi:hypothetical protein
MGGSLETVCVERRRHSRTAVERSCKLLHAPTLRYLSARTCDLSPGGALIELWHERELAVGDRVDVVVDWAARGLVNRGAMVGATVVRLGERDGARQRVGVRFDRPEPAVTLAA